MRTDTTFGSKTARIFSITEKCFQALFVLLEAPAKAKGGLLQGRKPLKGRSEAAFYSAFCHLSSPNFASLAPCFGLFRGKNRPNHTLQSYLLPPRFVRKALIPILLHGFANKQILEKRPTIPSAYLIVRKTRTATQRSAGQLPGRNRATKAAAFLRLRAIT
ncbi:hypothetical protein SAMN05216383_10955 [Prevotella sp. KH2C16]|nr:hypothetical protein SAMN05216383_10955 [Prevotella sp. KH2C16]